MILLAKSVFWFIIIGSIAWFDLNRPVFTSALKLVVPLNVPLTTAMSTESRKSR